MNLSVNTALRYFGEVTEKACKDELKQIFQEKKVLVPVKWEFLCDKQKKQIVQSHMFLKEKLEDGIFCQTESPLGGRWEDSRPHCTVTTCCQP
jgi:hypothetical protein